MYMTTNATLYGSQNGTVSFKETSFYFNVCCLTFLLIFTAPVNIVIIYLLSHQRKTIHTCGFTTFAISLAVTDTLVGLIIVPVSLVRYSLKYWPLDKVCCILFQVLDYGFTSVSVIIMAAMGYDRYKCVTSPMSYRVNFKQRRVIMTLVIIWILGIGAWVPLLTVSHFNSDRDRVSGICTITNSGYLVIPHALIMYHLPLVFTIITYIKILLNLRKRLHVESAKHGKRGDSYIVPDISETVNQDSESFKNNSGEMSEQVHYRRASNVTPTVSTVNSASNATSERSHDIQEPHDYPNATTKYLTTAFNVQNQRCSKTSILIVTSFVLCWGPVCVLWPLVQVCENCIDINIYHAISVLSYANSTINPFIYLATSAQLRLDFKKFILRK